MDNEKDRFGEKMRLVEKAKEDIYFAARDRELIEKLKARLQKVERTGARDLVLLCPKCGGRLDGYTFLEILLDRCQSCGGIWLDRGELEGLLRKVSRAPLARIIRRFVVREEGTAQEKR